MSQVFESIQLLEEAVEQYPSIKYGNKLTAITDSRWISNWLWSWIPRVQRVLDDYKMSKSVCNHDLAEKETMCADGFCPVCMYNRLNELEKKLNIYGTPVTIEIAIDDLNRQIADFKDDQSKWQHTLLED